MLNTSFSTTVGYHPHISRVNNSKQRLRIITATSLLMVMMRPLILCAVLCKTRV